MCGRRLSTIPTNLLALWFQLGGRGYVGDGDQGTFRIIAGEPPAILPITFRPRKSANTTQRRQLLSQSRTPRRCHYVVDEDRDRELPAHISSFVTHNTRHLLIFNAKAFGWSKLATGPGPLVDS